MRQPIFCQLLHFWLHHAVVAVGRLGTVYRLDGTQWCNMPLAITGQEAVWFNVWKKFGLSDEEILGYFTGPAHLPWHRMANLDYWQGNLPKSWLTHQVELQKKIVTRERELNMTPVLPAFAGHVPAALKKAQPNAKINRLGHWGGFPDKYRSSFLDPLDPLFPQIQKAFITEQTKLFGTDHIYGTDPFNEVKPPSWEPDYLARVGKAIYESMAAVDPDAVWMQMTWVFYYDRKHWTNERIKAMVHSVPQDKMLLLDYYCENKEVWKMTESFFGQPYIWCYLGNFGGNTMLCGNLKTVDERIENTFKNGGKNMSGLGSTLEALDVNPLMYEFLFEKVWTKGETNIPQWVDHYAASRCGSRDPNYKKAWQILLEKVYTQPAHLGQGALTNARPTLKGWGNWTTNPRIKYDNADLIKAWALMLKVEDKSSDAYQYDLVNIARQAISNHFKEVRDAFTKAYEAKDKKRASAKAQEMLSILDDLETLLSTRNDCLLGKWLADAKSFGENEKERQYYEMNARTLLTTWGEKGQSLNDYANRTWAGLIKGYYRPRWEMFTIDVLAAMKSGKEFDPKVFHEKVIQFEWDWTKKHDIYPAKKSGDSVKEAAKLFTKYQGCVKQTP